MGILGAFVVPHPAVIVPEIGKGQEKKVQKTIDAYQVAAHTIGELRPETIVLISPHQVMYANYFISLRERRREGILRNSGPDRFGWRSRMTKNL